MGLVPSEGNCLTSRENDGVVGEGIEEKMGEDADGNKEDGSSGLREEVYREDGVKVFTPKVDQNEGRDPEDRGVGELGSVKE